MRDPRGRGDVRDDRAVRLLERAVPWIVFGLVTAIVVLSLIAVVVGAPWAR